MNSDPTPGDPDRVRELAEKLQAFADDASDALTKVRDLVGDDSLASFVGQTAEAFKDRFDKVPPNLTKLHTSYDLAAQALAKYWPKLEDAQRDADSALTDATEAKSDLDSAQTLLSAAATSLEDAEDAAEDPDEDAVASEVRRALTEAESAHSGAESTVASAQERLEAAKGLAQQAKEAREEAAEACANDLDEASDAGMQNKKWWQKAVDWVVDNWDTIVAIAKIVVAVLGIVVMIIGGPLAWIVLAAALIVLADTLIDYANGNASLWDVAFAALDCIPGFKGLTTVAGLAGGIKKYATNFKNMKSMFQAQGIRGIGKVLIGDPIDIATGEMTLRETDLELSGVLPLTLEREHLSNYRNGHWFGRSWASTLDQRLTLNQWGVDYYADDGMILHYPIPKPDYNGPVHPVSGPRWSLAWNGRPGAPMTIQTDDGRTLHFAPAPGRKPAELPITAISDRNTNRIDIRYDEEGAPAEITHTGGYRIGIGTYDNRITSFTLLSDPDQPVLRAFDYDDNGNLSAVFNSSGLPLCFEYDDRRRMTRWEDRNHTWYSYQYDEAGRCVFTTGTDRALEYRYHYDTDNLRTTATNGLGHATVYQMNDAWQVIAETDPLGHTTHRTWDEYNRPLTITDPLGRTTAYGYDVAGNLARVTRPDGSSVRAEYNDLGLVTELTLPDGSVWRQSYDDAGNSTALADPAGGVITRTYHPGGAPATVASPVGDITMVAADPAGLPVAVTDAAGGATSIERDAFGRPVKVTDPSGAPTSLEWSVEGWLLRRTDALGASETFTWDAEGNLVAQTDANGGETTYTYGPFELPVARTDPDGTTYRFTRDSELRISSITNGLGQTWEYMRDPAGRVTAETDFGGRITRYRHDAAGQPVSTTNAAGQSLSWFHDALGELIGKRTSDGEETAYTRDRQGRVLGATGPGTDVARTYDVLGNLLSETVNGRTTRWTYDAEGRVVGRRTPAGHDSGWAYAPGGDLEQLVTGGQAVRFRHDAAGREVSRSFGEGLTFAQSWDRAGRLASDSLAVGDADAGLFSRSYRYRADGYLVEAVDSSQGRSSFVLDPLGRVTGASTPAGEESYTYDGSGNQLTADWPAGSSRAVGGREFTGDLLTAAGAVDYEYDEAGRTVRRRVGDGTERQTWHYTWNADDQLTQVVTPERDTWRYTYDPFGRRVAKSRMTPDRRSTEEVRFVWEDTLLVEESLGEGTSTTWTYRDFTPLTQTTRRAGDPSEGAFLAVITDLVGTPTHLTDAGGVMVQQDPATIWGGATADNRAGPTPLRFPGQYADPETGWNYNYHRHYDPDCGRYTTLDPLGVSPSPNPYAYAHNPLTWCDPLGLMSHANVNSVSRQQSDDVAKFLGYTKTPDRSAGKAPIWHNKKGNPKYITWDRNGHHPQSVFKGSNEKGAFQTTSSSGRDGSYGLDISADGMVQGLKWLKK
jgi:RHS repeat-associated protein